MHDVEEIFQRFKQLRRSGDEAGVIFLQFAGQVFVRLGDVKLRVVVREDAVVVRARTPQCTIGLTVL